MPRRDDLSTIMVLGSGPIVIGQAGEFDYSGTQGTRGAARGGLSGRPGQLQPGDDHDRPAVADRTYVEPLDVESVEAIIELERPDALLPTLGGQTALNLAMDLSAAGVLERFGVELIGADVAAIRRAEDREALPRARWPPPGSTVPENRVVSDMEAGRRAVQRARPAGDPAPGVHPGRRGRRRRPHARGVRVDARARRWPRARSRRC